MTPKGLAYCDVCKEFCSEGNWVALGEDRWGESKFRHERLEDCVRALGQAIEQLREEARS